MPIPYAKPQAPSDDKRWKIVETRMRRMGDRPQALIEALHAAQEAFGFLDTDALQFVGDTLGVPHSRVYGVATFYSYFTLKPQGEHTCVVCTGTACYINGAKEIITGFEKKGACGFGLSVDLSFLRVCTIGPTASGRTRSKS